ncbi:MAG TPA: hypothetical protein P5277_01665 [Candidatus Paceibacterota bacterium]|nr:hypothetical protein [Candidatus Paceibacterota bacterium]
MRIRKSRFLKNSSLYVYKGRGDPFSDNEITFNALKQLYFNKDYPKSFAPSAIAQIINRSLNDVKIKATGKRIKEALEVYVQKGIIEMDYKKGNESRPVYKVNKERISDLEEELRLLNY